MQTSKLPLFIMMGQSAEKSLTQIDYVVPNERIKLDDQYNLGNLMPLVVKEALHASEAYKLFFVFESYLRTFILSVLSEGNTSNWWEKIPSDIKRQVEDLEKTEEAKTWMAIGSRDRSALMTYPQLLKIIDDLWASHFSSIIRDKVLLQQARTISHLRNNICHMSDISDEEISRIKQTMKDWFRMVSP